MVKYEISLSKKAKKHFDVVKQSEYAKTAKALLQIISENPYQTPPPYEKLSGDLNGCYSRRINKQHRIVYEISEESHKIRVISMWSHYE